MNVPRILVAGVGNILFGDDGFGVEVARSLLARRDQVGLDPAVSVVDFGIRGLHLAYELTESYQAVVVIDALPLGHAPGTLYVVEPDLGPLMAAADAEGEADSGAGRADAHGMDLPMVFATARGLGAELPPVTIVGCEPGDLGEHIGLSHEVAGSVEQAVTLVRDATERALGRPRPAVQLESKETTS